MGLPFFGLKLFIRHIQPHLFTGDEICFLSCPDIIAKPQDVAKLFNIPLSSLKIREDSAKIIEWHKANKITDQIVDTCSLFETLGYKVTTTDIVKARSDEEFLDLNVPILQIYECRFKFIFENCIDHCFNIGQAFKNVVQMTALNGVILHLNPLLMINHGFWSISPTTYYDFYKENELEILYYSATKGINTIEKVYDFDPYKRVKDIEHDSIQICIAKKTIEQKLKWPTQYKFKTFPESKK